MKRTIGTLFIILLLMSNLASALEVRTAYDAVAISGDKQWDLVVLGDTALSDFAQRFADYLSKALGIQITEKTYIFTTSQEMVKSLESDDSLKSNLIEAEVIVYHIPRAWMDWTVFESYSLSKIEKTLPEALKAYQQDVEEIFDLIAVLRSPTKAIIRTMNIYAYWPVKIARTNGSQDLLHKNWKSANDYLADVATRHKIPVAKIYERFNGVSGRIDHIQEGYVEENTIQPTPRGSDLLSDLVEELDLGYELYDCT